MRSSQSAILRSIVFLTVYAHSGDLSAHGSNAKMAQMMILATYHMPNSGLDPYKLKADNVLTECRQRQINQVVDKLERFHRTKIAVEGQSNENYWTSRYSDHLADRMLLGIGHLTTLSDFARSSNYFCRENTED